MARITSLDQNVANGDTIDEQWFDAVNAAIAKLTQDLANTQQELETIKSQVTESLIVSLGGGLRLEISPGRVTLPDRTVSVIPSSNLQAIANDRSYIYINTTGQLEVSTTEPADGLLELAEATANDSEVTQLTNYPRLRVSTPTPNLDLLATRAYVDDNKFKPLATARKTSAFNIPQSDTYYVIPFESLTGSGFNTSGQFTAQKDGQILATAQIRVDTTRPDLYRDLSVKFSMFDVNSELGLPLSQMESADGDLTHNAITAAPITVTTGQVFTFRIYISFRNRQVTTNDRIRVRENSRVTIWQV